MLESLQQTNIGHLNLEESKPGSDYFAKLITPQDLTKIQTILRGFWGNERVNWMYAYELMFGLGVVLPDKTKIPMSLNLNASDYSFIEESNELEGWAYIKLFKPEFFTVFEGFRGEHFKKAKDTLYPYLNHRILSDSPSTTWPNHYTPAYLPRDLLIAKYVFPNDQTQTVVDNFIPEFLAILREFPFEKSILHKLDWFNLARTIRILKPKIKEELKLPNNMLSEGKQLLDWYRENGSQWVSFVQVLSAMKILLAEDLQMTSEGLKVIMENDFGFQVKTPALPEVRKF